jgi:hypothetical protein
MRRTWIALAALLVVFACAWCSGPRAAEFHVFHDGVEAFCATRGPMGFEAPYSFGGTCAPAPPPTGCLAPAGLTRLMRSNITYGAQGSAARANVDLTEWANIWGHATPTDAGRAWAGVSGAGPVIRAFGKHTFIAAHFNTGATAMYQGSFAYQSNIGGPDIDVVVSRACGDFASNAPMPGCSVTMPSDGLPHLKYFSNAAPPGSTQCSLALNTDYWINIRMHDPLSSVECAGTICPLFTINYWAPVR